MEGNISVLMSVYKNDLPQNVRAAVESVVNQTLKPKQIVMVVDGPVSAELKNELLQLEKEIDIYKNFWLQHNCGLGHALREGTKHCEYNFIARADSDDICLPSRFEKQFAYLNEHHEVGVVGCLGQEFYDREENLVSVKTAPEEHEQIVEFMKSRCPICNTSAMIRKSSLLEVGGYESWPWAEDWYLWIRMYLSGIKFYNIQEVLVKIRINQGTFNRRHGIKYYKSIKGILKFMYQNKIISYPKYLKGKLIRFVGHVLVPRKSKCRLYRMFLRNKLYNRTKK